MKEIILDFHVPKKPKTVWEFHEHLIEPLELEKPTTRGIYQGYKYAKNFDALWDLMYLTSENSRFVIRNIDKLNKELDEEVADLKELFARLEKQDENVEVVYE